DLQEMACIHTVEAIMSPVIFAISLPGRPYLVTGSKHRTVQVWSSTDFRLVRTVNLQAGGPVRGLVCLMDSRRVAIGQSNSLSIMEIDDEEAVASEGSK
uniref:Uncharacterized protein n=3 Tax=Triticinae TaxID=1648030 RepID=A0A453TC83_AEGTS